MHLLTTKTLVISIPIVLVLAVSPFVSVPPPRPSAPIMQTEPTERNQLSDENPPESLRLLFIHHSCGGQWLAPVGPDRGEACIYETAANGGGLRERLASAGYEVHEASYGSLVGDKTDVFDWPHKFRDRMEEVLGCDHQDTFYDDGRRNHVVAFKPCFPNNLFVGSGQAPGNPEGPELTVENAKAAYRALLAEFEKHPDTLFVAVTAPPMALGRAPLYKVVARRLLGRPNVRASGPYARRFNHWLQDPENGWLSVYQGTNVAVFDLYDVLTDHGASDFSRYPTGSAGDDSHPSSEGNQKATEAFVPFLNRAVRRAGLDKLRSTGRSCRGPGNHE